MLKIWEQSISWTPMPWLRSLIHCFLPLVYFLQLKVDAAYMWPLKNPAQKRSLTGATAVGVKEVCKHFIEKHGLITSHLTVLVTFDTSPRDHPFLLSSFFSNWCITLYTYVYVYAYVYVYVYVYTTLRRFSFPQQTEECFSLHSGMTPLSCGTAPHYRSLIFKRVVYILSPCNFRQSFIISASWICPFCACIDLSIYKSIHYHNWFHPFSCVYINIHALALTRSVIALFLYASCLICLILSFSQ